MLPVTVINIEWQLIEFNQEIIKEFSKETDCGIYQIYGQHPAYGRDALLYIGQASRFSERLKNRFEFVESSALPTSIRLGRIVNSKNEKEEENIDRANKKTLTDIAEQILVKVHTPAFNQVYNKGLFDGRGIKGEIYNHYIILNWQNYGLLLPEVSTLRFSYRFWDFEHPI